MVATTPREATRTPVVPDTGVDILTEVNTKFSAVVIIASELAMLTAPWAVSRC